MSLRFRLAWRAFDALTPRELHDVLRLRCEVFIVEQRCAFDDIDGRDPEAMHLLAWIDGQDALAGTLRLFAPDDDRPRVRIGRVATAGFARGRGLGRALMQDALAESRRRFGPVEIEIGAQSRLEDFYGSLGFVRAGDDYIEDGIAHCRMMHC